MLQSAVHCGRDEAGSGRSNVVRRSRKDHREQSKSTWLRQDCSAYDRDKNQSNDVAQESNLHRLIFSITPSVPVQYLSKTTVRSLRMCDVEFQPYFLLGDLWESFKEWSAYGAGVPLILNEGDCVIQYYVPYLSAIQIYVKSLNASTKSSWLVEDCESDFVDSSSDGSSDQERDRINKFGRLSMREQMEEFSSDEEESITKGRLLFEYFENNPPYCREPLADKIFDLASRFPALKTLRSCDLLPSSWLSVAWYPIYRIPTGPTLKDLDACFLTYHTLHSPIGGARTKHVPIICCPSESLDSSRMLLQVFGLASYKFRTSLWTSIGGSDRQLAESLLQAAHSWVRLVQANHPDFMFFSSRSP